AELAEAAHRSPRSVSDLERGITRTARKETARLLADALGLAEPARTLFVAAARGRGAAAEVLAARDSASPGVFAAAATRALPRDIASFTGRQAERARLLGALDSLAAGGGAVGRRAGRGVGGWGGWGPSRGWRGAARPHSRCTPRPGSPAASPRGSSSCRCTPTPPGSGRSAPRMRWPVCC